MSRYIYLEQPGILYDMMFALKLKFNGERAYIIYKEEFPSYAEDEKFFRTVIEKLDDISDRLLPFFYWRESPKILTGLLAYMRDCIKDLRYTEDTLIEDFYDSLRDVGRLKKFLYSNYVSDNCPDIIDISSFGEIRDELMNADLPDAVKLRLMEFLLYGETEIESIISELRTVQAHCEELRKIHAETINKLISGFDEKKLSLIGQTHMWDLSKYDRIYFTYCVVNIYTIYGTYYDNDWISYLGMKSDQYLLSHTPEIEINLFELGRILYDETRLKILKMLQEKEMYCAEIAKELGLKNNSTLYHLNMMENQKLLVIAPRGKKLYYYIAPNYLISLKKLLNNILNGESQ